MKVPEPVAEFLGGRRIAVAGVSRQRGQPANVVLQRLRRDGREVVAVNPHATELEGVPCYPDVSSIPGSLDGVFIATHPRMSMEVIRQCAAHDVRRVWFHRSFGQGSVSEDAVRACRDHDISCIVGGCPLMFCEPVDPFHRCMRWWLQWRGRIPR